MKVEIDTEKIKDASKTLEDEKANIEQEIKNLQSEIEKISSIWKGTDATTFIQLFDEKLISCLIRVNELVDLYGTDLGVVASTYEVLDDTFSEKSIEV